MAAAAPAIAFYSGQERQRRGWWREFRRDVFVTEPFDKQRGVVGCCFLRESVDKGNWKPLATMSCRMPRCCLGRAEDTGTPDSRKEATIVSPLSRLTQLSTKLRMLLKVPWTLYCLRHSSEFLLYEFPMDSELTFPRNPRLAFPWKKNIKHLPCSLPAREHVTNPVESGPHP